LLRRIIGSTGAGAADLDARASGPERLCDAIADAAGAADYEDTFSAEVEFVHRRSTPVIAGLDPAIHPLREDSCEE
jgi:hypothetical protein